MAMLGGQVSKDGAMVGGGGMVGGVGVVGGCVGNFVSLWCCEGVELKMVR